MAFNTNPTLAHSFVRPFHIDELIACYSAGETKTVLQNVKADLVALIEAGQTAGADDSLADFTLRPNSCQKCGGEGIHLKSKDTGVSADNDINKICNLCGGWTRTEAAYTPVVSYPDATLEEYRDEKANS